MAEELALEKAEEPAKKDKKKNQIVDGSQPVPYLLEALLTISKVLVILTGIAVTGVSVYRGADPLSIGLRSGTSMFAMGILLWTMNWVVSNNIIEVARETQTRKEDHKKQKSDSEA